MIGSVWQCLVRLDSRGTVSSKHAHPVSFASFANSALRTKQVESAVCALSNAKLLGSNLPKATRQLRSVGTGTLVFLDFPLRSSILDFQGRSPKCAILAVPDEGGVFAGPENFYLNGFCCDGSQARKAMTQSESGSPPTPQQQDCSKSLHPSQTIEVALLYVSSMH